MDFSGLDAQQKPAIFPIEFRTDYEPDPTDPTKMIGKDIVTWGKKGTSNGWKTSDKVDRLKKGSIEWPVLEPYYEAWKKNQQAPVDGTPLDAWPGLTVAQAKVLRDHNLRSVEDLAEASDSTLAKIGMPGIRSLQIRARAFIEAGQTKSAVAEEMAKRDEQIASLQSQLTEALQAIHEMKKDEDQPAKRGPGRPRKEQPAE